MHFDDSHNMRPVKVAWFGITSLAVIIKVVMISAVLYFGFKAFQGIAQHGMKHYIERIWEGPQ